MKVAMVSEHASPLAVLGGVDAGGQNVHVAALATELGRRGAHVTVHTRREDPSVPARVALAPNVTVAHVDAGPPRPVPKDDLLPYMGTFAACLAREWGRDRPDVAHAHFWMSGRAALAAVPDGVPVVQTFHALGVVKRRHQGAKDTSPSGRSGCEREIVRRVDRIVATCSDEVFELARMGTDVGRVTVVPCGVDLGLFRPDGPREPRRGGVHRLVAVGRLVERKGLGNVISALADVPGTELVIAGGPDSAGLWDDPEARRLVALARAAGVEGRVELRGRVGRADLPGLLRSADAVVCVPWYEPFGMVPLEAMACGIPVVVSAVGGLVDTVVDGVTGLHVPPRRPDRLAHVLRRLLANPERRGALGAAGAARARQLYSWRRVADATLDVYREVVAERQPAAERVAP